MAQKQNWIVTFGNAEIAAGTITHIPVRQRVTGKVSDEADTLEATRKAFPPHTLIRSNVEFEQGKVSWEVFLPEPESTCELLLSTDPAAGQSSGSAADPVNAAGTDVELAFGVNVMGAPYGFAILRNYVWEGLLGVGHGSHVPTNKWIQLFARVTGSNIDMYVDEVKVASTSRVLRRVRSAFSCKATRRSSSEI